MGGVGLLFVTLFFADCIGCDMWLRVEFFRGACCCCKIAECLEARFPFLLESCVAKLTQAHEKALADDFDLEASCGEHRVQSLLGNPDVAQRDGTAEDVPEGSGGGAPHQRVLPPDWLAAVRVRV